MQFLFNLTPEGNIMQGLLKTFVASVALVASMGTMAADRCQAGPKAQWRAQAELEAQLKAEGWKIKRVKVDKGCYEVYGTDGQDKKRETFFHPKTFESMGED